MVHDPRSTDDIYSSIESRLTSTIDRVTNFVDGGFNDVWVSAYSEQLHQSEVKLLAAELAGYVDTAGKSDFTESELERLGITGVDPDELNEHMDDQQLDELAKIVGAERDQGSKATGQVTFTVTSDSISIPEGYEVGTEPDESGDFYSYYVDADGDGTVDHDSGASVSPDAGSTTVTAQVVAADVGDEYNVGPDSVTNMPTPKAGVEAVSNGSEISGGEDVQSNDEFREDIKQAVFTASGGGTARGVEGYVEEEATSDVDAETAEFTSQSPPYVEVIVDGGIDSEIKDLIAESKPVGIRHELVRPKVVNVGIRSELVGQSIDSENVRRSISDYLVDLTLDENYRRSRVIQRILNTDNDIVDVGSLTTMLTNVKRESSTYQSGTSVYPLDHVPLGSIQGENRLYDSETSIYPTVYSNVTSGSVVVEAIVDGNRQELTSGTDYSLVDDDGDGNYDAIDFSVGGSSPDDRTVFTIEYDHGNWSVNSTITDIDGNSYTQGTDWTLVDSDGDGLNDAIDFSIGGGSPADQTRFFVDYSPKIDAMRDLPSTRRSKIADAGQITLTTLDPK